MYKNLLIMPDGTQLCSGTPGQAAIQSVTLTQCVNGDTELTLGAVCAGMLEVTVLAPSGIDLQAGQQVTLYKVSQTGERLKMGVYTLEKPSRESANVFTLTAYDCVSRLDRDLTDWLAGLEEWPYALYDFAKLVCAACDLELANTELPNGSYMVQPFSAEGVTGRQLMQWVGQAAGRFCRATADGQLEFAWYENTARNIGPAHRQQTAPSADMAVLTDLTQGMQIQAVSQLPVSVTGLTGLTLTRCGANLCSLGSVSFTQIARVQNAVRLSAGTYTLSAVIQSSDTDAAQCTVIFRDSQDTTVKQIWLKRSQEDSRVSGTFVLDRPAVGLYLYASNSYAAGAGDTATFADIQIEAGSAATPYVPYAGEAFTLDFGQTVCGGSLDWNRGLLTVTHGCIDAYAGETVPEGWLSDTGELSEGARVVYPLAQPQTLRLKGQRIGALEGYNALQCDAGQVAAQLCQQGFFLNGLRYEDYTVAPIRKVQLQSTEDDVGVLWPQDAPEGNTYRITGNYLLTTDTTDALLPVAQTLYEQLKDVAYTPCQVSLPADPECRAGDIVTVLDRNGRAFPCYVMTKTQTGQKDTLECTGNPSRDSTTAVNQQSYQALTGRVLELRTQVEGLKAENRDAAGNLASLSLAVEGIDAKVRQQTQTAEGIRQQVTALEQSAQGLTVSVQELRESGAEKVRTAMGYTFDDEGLKIVRSGEQMENRLDNTGMYVTRAGTTILQANNNGVVARDVQVNNYLRIGEHARFEDYTDGTDSKRTACFFIGEN